MTTVSNKFDHRGRLIWQDNSLNTCVVQAGVENRSCGREGLHLFDADQAGAIEFHELKADMRSLR